MLLLCATAGWALPDQDENGYYLVSNLQELKDAVNATKDSQGKSTSKIKLTDNIYLNGMQNTLCTTFAGEIDGSFTVRNNKGIDVTLKNMIFGSTLGDEETRKKCSYLFTYLEDATIKNVAFYNIRIESDDRDNMGVIASTATNTTFEQVSLEKCSIFTDENNAGAVVGQAKNCKFFVVFVNSCSVTVDGVRAGGFVGYSENNQYVYGGSSLGTAVFADGNNGKNGGWSGGIAGYSKNDKFYYMANLALVGADQNFVGGYAGESEGSNFYRCQNSGAVLQIDEDDSDPEESFRAIHEKMLDEINKTKSTSTIDAGLDVDTKIFACMLNVGGDLDLISTLDLQAAPQTRMTGVGPSLVARLFEPVAEVAVNVDWSALSSLLTYENAAGWVPMGGGEAAAAASTGLSFGAACAIGAAVVVVVVAAAITIYIFNGDDEVGGICGKATGGFFEQCTNNATLSCRDDNCGGIVGLGIGVTINNCLNTGKLDYDEESSSGAILGQAKANGSKKCKVTNCFSTIPFQIIGSWYIDDGVDDASGNNYRWKGNFEKACDWEMVILDSSLSDLSYLKGKQVGYLLNNGVENRRAGIAPWRYPGNLIFAYPNLDPSYDEITVEGLPHTDISTADELLAFAAAVNSGEQFKVGILTADIVIPKGKTWTPIGKNEANKHFRGIFDGQGHTISGLEVEINSEDQGAGLFGTIHSNAIIRNVILDNTCKITNNGIGGAAGIVGRFNTQWYWSEAIIENCANYASVNAFKHAGGILGRVFTGANNGPSVRVYVENCYNMGTITAGDGDSGLLCGYTKDHGYVSNCWSGGKLKMADPNYQYWPFSTVNDNNDRKIECLVGYNTKHHVENCYIVDPDVNVDHYDYRTDYALSLQDGVTIVSDKEIATGELTYLLNGSTNDVNKRLTWQQELGKDALPVPGSKGVYHTRSISNTIGTACLPYALKSDDAIRYYTFSESSQANGETKLNFDYAETVAPGTPVLFRVAETGDVTFSGVGEGWAASPVAPASATWNFTGTYEEQTFTGEAAKTIYYVSGGKIKHGTKATIAPYRAYFEGPNIDELTSGSNAKHVRIVIDGEEGETSVLELVYENHNENRCYTLFGTEAGEGYRGIVIRGGKKVVINN